MIVPFPMFKEAEMNKLKGIFLTLTANHKLNAARRQLAWCPFTVSCLLPVYQSRHRAGMPTDVVRLSFQDRRTEKEGFISLIKFSEILILILLQNIPIQFPQSLHF